MWTKEIPKHAGWYWFFGYIFSKKGIPQLEMVNINQFGMPNAHNAFLSENEIIGLWIRVEIPEPFDIETAKWAQVNLLGDK